MKRLQPLAPLTGSPRIAQHLPSLSVDGQLSSRRPAPLPASAPLTRDSTSDAALPDLCVPRKETGDGREGERDDAERRRELDSSRSDRPSTRRSSSSANNPPLSPISPRSSPSPRGRHALPSSASAPVSTGNAMQPSPRGRPALEPIVVPSAATPRRGLLPIIAALSQPTDNDRVPVSPSSAREREAKKAGRKKKLRVKAAIEDDGSRNGGDEQKEAEAAPAETPSASETAAASSASSVSADSSDSDAEDEPPAAQLPSAPPLLFSATAPVLSPPVTEEENSLFSSTAPIVAPSPPALPPSSFPDPLPFGPPTSPSSLTLSVFVGTWNLHGRPPPPPSVLSSFLPTDRRHDLLVVGTEEVDMSIERAVLLSPVGSGRRDRWVRRVLEVVGEDEYEKVEEEAMVAMHIVVLIRRSLRHLLSQVEKGRVATGVGDVIGNKGAVAVCLDLGRTSLLLVNSHLAAHQHAVEQRNADFWKINNRMNLRSKAAAAAPSAASAGLASPPSSSLLTDRFDRVLWLGDLNYRIEGSHRLVCHLIGSGLLEPLLHNDQLLQQRQQGRVFPGFHEHPIAFRPTYKLEPGSNPAVYDRSKKKRVPGWTDRVLWRDREGGAGLQCLSYASVEDVRTSDHFPVVALFNLRVDGVKEKEEPAGLKQQEQKEDSRSAKQSGAVRKRSSAAQVTPAASPPPPAAEEQEEEGHRRHGSVIDMTFGGTEEEAEMQPDAADAAAPTSLGTEKDSRVCAVM